MEKTLVILAAGIGSRFGSGIKQLEPIDDYGHIIIDYSIIDKSSIHYGTAMLNLDDISHLTGNYYKSRNSRGSMDFYAVNE